jgi:hypothetical protein
MINRIWIFSSNIFYSKDVSLRKQHFELSTQVNLTCSLVIIAMNTVGCYYYQRYCQSDTINSRLHWLDQFFYKKKEDIVVNSRLFILILGLVFLLVVVVVFRSHWSIYFSRCCPTSSRADYVIYRCSIDNMRWHSRAIVRSCQVNETTSKSIFVHP